MIQRDLSIPEQRRDHLPILIHSTRFAHISLMLEGLDNLKLADIFGQMLVIYGRFDFSWVVRHSHHTNVEEIFFLAQSRRLTILILLEMSPKQEEVLSESWVFRVCHSIREPLNSVRGGLQRVLNVNVIRDARIFHQITLLKDLLIFLLGVASGWPTTEQVL